MICRNIMLALFVLLLLAVQTVIADYPYFALGTCNITCSACSNKQSANFCLGCDASLTLNSENGSCSIPVTDRTVYQEMFSEVSMQNNTTAIAGWQKYNVQKTDNLTVNDIRGCCNPAEASYFHFDLIGLFNSTFALSKEFAFDYDVESVQLLFRGFYFFAPIKFTATVNTDQAISQTVDANFDSPPDNLTTDGSIINCSIFNYETSPIYSKKFISQKIGLITNKVLVRITAEFTTSGINTVPNGYWGVREVVLLATKCSSCPSPQLISFSSYVGIAFGGTLAILLILGAPLAIVDYLRRK